MVASTLKQIHNTMPKHSKAIAAIAAIATLLTASFAMQPVLAQTYQDKSKTPNYIRAKSDPNNTCVTSGDDTKCATASTSGIAEVKIVENTLGTWFTAGYHEMYPGMPGAPSSGFFIDTDGYTGYWGKFEVTLEGKVQIQKNGKTVEARYGGVVCDRYAIGGQWVCDKVFYAKKTTDGTHTIPAGTIIYSMVLLPYTPDNQEHTMGSLFECYTTGTGGGVTHTRCDAYDGDKYFKATKLRVSWPWI